MSRKTDHRKLPRIGPKKVTKWLLKQDKQTIHNIASALWDAVYDDRTSKRGQF